MPTNREQVLELYTAMFNRAADIEGLDYWVNEMENNNWSILDVASSFSEQSEYIQTYSGGDNREFITSIYSNLLGRAPDQEGLDYWVGELDSGVIQTAHAVTAIIAGAKGNDTAQGILDAQLISNKTTISDYFANTLGLNDVAQASAIMSAIDTSADSVNQALQALHNVVAEQYNADAAGTHNGHTYLVFNAAKTFAEAQAAAVQLTGSGDSSLAMIDSAEENQFILDLLESSGITSTAQDGGGAIYSWIGASDSAQESNWQWVNGNALDYTNWGTRNGATEPDNFDNSHLDGNYSGQQDSAAIALSDWPVGLVGQWNDVDSNNQLSYVVEVAP